MSKKVLKTTAKKQRLLATGGGNATASGVTLQGSIGAYFAARGLAEATLDPRLGLGAAKPIGVRFETEAPVDDILIPLDSGGWGFIQAKNSLKNSGSLTSELGKTCDEFVRLWEAASKGSGAHGWDRPLRPGVDVLVIAVGPTTSGTIKHHLARALDIARTESLSTLSQAQRDVLEGVRALLGKALVARGGTMASVNPNAILQFVHILEFDFGGPHRTTAEAILANVLTIPSLAPAAFTTLEAACERCMAGRKGVSLAALRAELARGTIPVSGPPSYRPDITALQLRTTRVEKELDDFAHTRMLGTDVTVPRACAAACVAAAKNGSLVVVGDPGTGKSAVIKDTAHQLSNQGSDVVLLAVDRLQVESVEGLSAALGINHPLADVLANWPGSEPAYLILDALDACRFGKSEALFRNVMQEVLSLDQGRWRVVASIRTFDLMVGQEFKRLFPGVPPSADLTDPRFQTSRHVRVPEWSDTEFQALLQRLPELRVAIDSGGPKLEELARVPFNTRLLADLLTAGIAPHQLKHLGSQVQLLEMYWDERVRPVGASAEQCLHNTVIAMIDRGRMEARRIDAGAGTGNALDLLLQRGVLISVSGDHDVAFRHHILFDYAASRTVIDLDNDSKSYALMKQSGANLLLAPALSFALQHLWETSGPEHERFWQIIGRFAGDGAGDPIARSVAARVACQLPSKSNDTAGLFKLMSRPGERDDAFGAFRHIVGALSVRLEDEGNVPLAPWCFAAEASVPFVAEIGWAVRVLIPNLVDRVTDPDMRRQIGIAARAIMNYAFDAEGGDILMPSVIGLVAKTFGTDPQASRRLVERLLEPDRMKTHAANDMHVLADSVRDIAIHDSNLVVQIYDRVFAHTVDDNAPTKLGHSKILPLTSNRRQDFQMSQWRLKDAFRAFAELELNAAAGAAIAVARGHIRNHHKPTAPIKTLTVTVGDQVGRIAPDFSYIWADPSKPLRSDDAGQIIDNFVEVLKTASDADAIAIADRLIANNESAWLWSRMLMVAAARGGALAAKLWPWANKVELLSSVDTMKPAIDLVASQYSQVSPAERQEFEASVMATAFPAATDPTKTALYFRRRVFGAIGRPALETQVAKAIVDEAVANARSVSNEDGYGAFEPRFVERDEHAWLRTKGVDVDAAPNTSILDAIRACPSITYMKQCEPQVTFTIVKTLHERLASSGTAPHPMVAAYGWEKLADTIDGLMANRALAAGLTLAQRTEVGQMLKSVKPALACLSAPDGDVQKRARKSAAGAIMSFVWNAPEAASHFAAEIRSLASDESPDVRGEIAVRLGSHWNADRALLWELAEGFVDNETNSDVLAHVVGFLIPASNDDPGRICALMQVISRRDNIDTKEERDALREGIGTLAFHLWTHHGKTEARHTIDLWLGDRTTYKAELQYGAFVMRAGLVVGYDKHNILDQERRTRCQNLAFDLIDQSARGLEEFLALKPADQSDARRAKASDDAALLDQMSNQFFFAAGAVEVQNGEEPRALQECDHRQRYLTDNARTFRRIGDVGAPSTIFNLHKLLDFLAPGSAALVFDLVAHALLQAGRIHGYQTEAMGADQLVKMIGRTIADHRDLFDDQDRRLALVEVLEIFVGWPAARRLLYRLPDALR